MASRRNHRESGQAAVESALALPLLVFLVLGTLQLFMLLQARIMAQYAVYKAVRSGAVLNGECTPMLHAALLSVMPTITRTDTPEALAAAFRARSNNRYVDSGYTEQILELVRESPDPASIAPPEIEDNRFDQPDQPNLPSRELTVRMLYWYRLKIPFADWVMGRMFLAHYGLQSYTAVNPLTPAQPNANWNESVPPGSAFAEAWPGGSVPANLVRWAAQGHYFFPIRVTASMRMMQPPRQQYFAGGKACPL